jgi:hypothetical protein
LGKNVRLLRPDGSVADSIGYTGSVADLSQSRGDAGEWYLSSANTPGLANVGPVVPTSTNTPSPTRTAAPTRTPSPTRTVAPTRTPSPTRTVAPTRTPSPTRTPKPTLTPKPSPVSATTQVAGALGIAKPAGIRLSEFMADPKETGMNEWVELSNDAETVADLSGWAIDDADGGGSPYRLPQGSVIAPHGLLLVELPKALFNNTGDSVRLLGPDGSVADEYRYSQGAPDLSFCRVEGAWSTCAPTPTAPNRAAAQDKPTSTPVAAPSQASSAPALHSAPSQPSAAVSLPFASWNERIASALAYANRTPGILYRGLVGATPTRAPSPQPSASAATRHIPSPVAARATSSLFGTQVGVYLIAIGGVLAGYDRLRARRARRATVLPEQDTPEVLGDEPDEASEELDV